jgi:hypothetical protein
VILCFSNEQGGKKELMRDAQLRREDLGRRADVDVREVRIRSALCSMYLLHYQSPLIDLKLDIWSE